MSRMTLASMTLCLLFLGACGEKLKNDKDDKKESPWKFYLSGQIFCSEELLIEPNGGEIRYEFLADGILWGQPFSLNTDGDRAEPLKPPRQGEWEVNGSKLTLHLPDHGSQSMFLEKYSDEDQPNTGKRYAFSGANKGHIVKFYSCR